MRQPNLVRPLTDEERRQLEEGLRSSDSFVFRRSQILLSSSQGQTLPEIGARIGRTCQTVRNVIRAFEEKGLRCLRRKSNRHHNLRTIFDDSGVEVLREILHQSPRNYDRPTSPWTLELAVSFEEGLSPHKVGTEIIRSAIK